MVEVYGGRTAGEKAGNQKCGDASSGAHDWNRTSDLLLTKEVLYRLSYVSRLFQQVLRRGVNGAGDGNRTRTISLEG